MKNIVSWFSIANDSGLNIVSLGRPGIRDNVNEQVVTGGMQATQEMLGMELGKDEDRWVGGGDTTKIGRFRVSDSDEHVVAQFLLMSLTEEPIPEELVAYSEHLVKDFTQKLITSEKWKRAQQVFQTLPPEKVAPEFLKSIVSAQKRFKLPLDEKTFEQVVISVFQKTLKEYEEFDVLVEIANFVDRSYRDAVSYIVKNRKEYITKLARAIFLYILVKEPLTFVFYKNITNQAEIIEEIEAIIKQFFTVMVPQTGVLINKVVEDVFKEDVKEIISPYNPEELRKARSEIKTKLENVTFHRIIQKQPLLMIGNSRLRTPDETYDDVIEDLIERIFAEFDLGNVLASLIDKLYSHETPESRELIRIFIREFSLYYSIGMSDEAWEFVTMLIHNIQVKAKKKTQQTVPQIIKGLNISERHKKIIVKKLETIQKLHKLKKNAIAYPSFTIEPDSPSQGFFDFFTALTESLAYAFQLFFSDVIWNGKDILGSFISKAVELTEEFCKTAQTDYLIIKMYNYLSEELHGTVPVEYLPPLRIFLQTRDDFSPSKLLQTVKKHTLQNVKEKYAEFSTVCKQLLKHHVQLKSGVVNFISDIKKQRTNASDFNKDLLEIKPLNYRNKRWKDQIDLLKTNYESFISWIKGEFEAEIKEYAFAVSANKKSSRHLDKITKKRKKEFLKRLKRLERLVMNLKNKNEDEYNTVKRTIQKELDGTQRHLDRIYKTELLSGLNLAFKTDSREETPSKDTIIENLVTQLQHKIDYDIFTLEDLITDLTLYTLFSKIRKSTINKTIEVLTSSTDRIASEVVSIALQDARHGTRFSDNFNFLDNFERRYVEFSRAKMANILININNELATNFFLQDIPINVIEEESKSVMTLKLASLNTNFLTKKDIRISKEHLIIVDKNDYQLHLKFPGLKVPETHELTIDQVMRWKCWNNLVEEKYQAFFELIEFGTKILGYEKKFAQFYEFISLLTRK